MTTEQLARNLLAIIDSEMYVNDFGGLQAGRDATTDIHTAVGKLDEALAQPKREWVGLTDARIKRIGNLDVDSNYFGLWYDFAKAIERELKEKNT